MEYENPRYSGAARTSNDSSKRKIQNAYLEHAELRGGRERRKVTKIAFRTAWQSSSSVEPAQSISVVPVEQIPPENSKCGGHVGPHSGQKYAGGGQGLER